MVLQCGNVYTYQPNMCTVLPETAAYQPCNNLCILGWLSIVHGPGVDMTLVFPQGLIQTTATDLLLISVLLVSLALVILFIIPVINDSFPIQKRNS